MENEVKRKGPFELSTDARILFNKLETVLTKEKKDFVSYKELSESINRNVQKSGNGVLRTARKHFSEEHPDIMLETVRNEGIKVSEDYEGHLDKSLKHIRKSSRKTTKIISRAIPSDKLTTAIVAKMGIHEVFQIMSKTKIPQKLLDTIEAKQLKELSTAETLKMFT